MDGNLKVPMDLFFTDDHTWVFVEDDIGNIATDYIKIQVLGFKIELMVGASLYYIGIFDTIFQIYTNFIDRITVSPPQTFAEKLIYFWR